MINNTKQCPFCGEEIQATAKKCRHCGEWLEDSVSNTKNQATTVWLGRYNIRLRLIYRDETTNQTHERLINYQYYNHCSSIFFDFMYGFNLYCRRRLHWNTYLSFCYIRYAYYINHNWSPIYPTLQRTIK